MRRCGRCKREKPVEDFAILRAPREPIGVKLPKLDEGLIDVDVSPIDVHAVVARKIHALLERI